MNFNNFVFTKIHLENPYLIFAARIRGNSKPRRKRKPMTEEQRAAAAERLKLAREKRAKSNPPQYKNVHPDVLAKPEDDALSFQKVKEWIKTNREKLPAIRQQVRSNQKGAIAQEAMIKGYIAHMEAYLKNGDWVSECP